MDKQFGRHVILAHSITYVGAYRTARVEKSLARVDGETSVKLYPG